MNRIIFASTLLVALCLVFPQPVVAQNQVPEDRVLREDFPFDEGFFARGIKIVERTWLASGGNAAPMRWPNLGQVARGPEKYVAVEYFLPMKDRKPVAVVMAPGPAMTSEMMTATPDGRDGWAQIFARAGYPVYVLNPGGELRSFSLPRELDEVWVHWGIGPEAGVAFEDSQFPVEHANVLAQNWWKFPQLAFVEHTIPLLDDIGPAVFVGHTIRSDAFFRTLWEDHPNVRGGITIEPGDCPIGEEEDVKRLYVDAKRVLMTLWGDNRGRGEPFASERLVKCRELVDAINEAGGIAETLLLPEDEGIHGNTNMMFLDLNNAQIAELVMAWIDKHVTAEPPVIERQPRARNPGQ